MSDADIRARRGPKSPPDPWRPISTLVEDERARPGEPTRCLTVFLAGAECPFTCVFCDLWRHTLDGATPRGAIPGQIRIALAEAPDDDPASLRVKLYNASNFFERRAVPPEDDAAVADLLRGHGAVTVENHPRLTGARCFRFAERLDGRLEVAMGLETVDARALARLNKKTTVADFDRAAAELRARGIDVRAFVLLGAPFESASPVASSVRSALHAFDQGARFVALNPVRAGNGAVDALRDQGAWRPPTLIEMERALARVLETCDGIAVVDTWALDAFRACDACDDARIAAIERMNRSGEPTPPVPCDRCDGGPFADA